MVETDGRAGEEAGCTVESPAQPVENTLGVATGRFPIGRRLATCPTILRWAFIPFGGPQAHADSQDWLPHKAGGSPGLMWLGKSGSRGTRADQGVSPTA